MKRLSHEEIKRYIYQKVTQIVDCCDYQVDDTISRTHNFMRTTRSQMLVSDYRLTDTIENGDTFLDLRYRISRVSEVENLLIRLYPKKRNITSKEDVVKLLIPWYDGGND